MKVYCVWIVRVGSTFVFYSCHRDRGTAELIKKDFLKKGVKAKIVTRE